MRKICLKCGHESISSQPSELAECPNCGIIYSKFEAAIARKSQAAGLSITAYLENEKLSAGQQCSGLLIPDTNLGENDRHREVSDGKATSYVFY